MRELDNFGISRSQQLQHTLNNENYQKKYPNLHYCLFLIKTRCQCLRLISMSKFAIDYNWQIPNKNGLHVRETRGEKLHR